jgi:hypothetical protein
LLITTTAATWGLFCSTTATPTSRYGAFLAHQTVCPYIAQHKTDLTLSFTHRKVKHGDRVAQRILEVILTPDVVEVTDLDDTARGAGGFGSTGV